MLAFPVTQGADSSQVHPKEESKATEQVALSAVSQSLGEGSLRTVSAASGCLSRPLDLEADGYCLAHALSLGFDRHF